MKKRTKAEEIRIKAKKDRDLILEKAILCWQESLTPEEQVAVLNEVVLTRGKELRLAYPDIMALGHGVRTVTMRGKRKILDEQCVVFMVRRKWDSEPKTMQKRARRLPGHLMAYCSTRTGRQMCAIPTNVESGHRYKKVKPHRQYVIARNPPITAQQGVFCCAVRIPGIAAEFGLSCHHVLAMSTQTNPPGSPASGAQVSPAGSQASMGALSAMGQLVPDSEVVSIDAALARIADMGAFALAIGGNPTTFWDRSSTINQCWVQCPPPGSVSELGAPTGTVSANYVNTFFDYSGITYFKSGTQPCQKVVIELQFNSSPSPKAGDSGSPVVDQNGMLLGMYIAGSDDGTLGFMLPADVLMSGVNYGLNVDLILSP
jgi:hypothetical protein